MAIVINRSAFSEVAETTKAFGFTAIADRLLVVFGTTRSNVLVPPGGWTVAQHERDASNDDGVVMWKVSDGSESQVAWGGGVSCHEFGVYEISNYDPASILSNNHTVAGTTTVYEGGYVAPTGAECLLLGLLSSLFDGAIVWTPDTGWVVDFTPTSSGGHPTSLMMHRAISSPSGSYEAYATGDVASLYRGFTFSVSLGSGGGPRPSAQAVIIG